MQQNDVVGAFAHRMMELDVDLGLFAEVGALVRRLHADHDAIEQRQILLGGPPCRIFGRQPLDLAAIF